MLPPKEELPNGIPDIVSPPNDTAPLQTERSDEDRSVSAEEPGTNSTDKVGKIASATGLTEQEVRDRIHAAKKNLPRNTGTRNPDVVVDLDTGEIYPKGANGTFGDSIGNIHDE